MLSVWWGVVGVLCGFARVVYTINDTLENENCFQNLISTAARIEAQQTNYCNSKELLSFSTKNFTEIEPPRVHCIDNSSDTFTFNQTYKELVYFLEYDRNEDFINSLFSNFTKLNILTIQNKPSNANYSVRLWGFSRDFTIYRSKSSNVLYKNSEEIQAVSNLRIANLTLTPNKMFTAQIVWDPANDFSCHYRILTHLINRQDSLNIINLDMTKKTKFEYYLYNLEMRNEFRTKYSLEIAAVSKTIDKESMKTTINITIPTCLEIFKNLVNCTPPKPKILGLEKRDCYTTNRNSTICDIKLKWISSKYCPDNYTAIFVTQSQNQETPTKYIVKNISGDSNFTIFKNVKLEEEYHVRLDASSKGGISFGVFNDKTKLIKDLTHYTHLTNHLLWAFVSALVCFLTLAILCAIAVTVFLILHKGKYISEDYLKDSFWNNLILKNDTLNKYYFSIFTSAIENDDPKWEIEERNLLLENIIGVGAFGIIQKGFLNSATDKKTIVAVKMLKAKPTLEQIRQFYDEIELMKTVPKHPHVVHLIGVVTKNRQSNPLMLTEYCEKGDLHSFLKKVWISLGNRDSNIIFSNSNDASFCKDFSNDFYEVDVKIPEPEYILESKDLLSFARQISIGMEFLSSLKIIHRDLATRNILITQDNATKISDFGLSKDVYTNNMYKKTTCGKLPFRWMALESLTHQIYTTESDVWSFGIVLWEIVTLGGYPYPSVESHDLVAHLKDGNRMERPINCSKELYSIMLQCWNASPKQRLSFTDLRNTFEKLLETEVEYVNLENVQQINYSHYQNLDKL